MVWDSVRIQDLYRRVIIDLGLDLDLEWEASETACLVAKSIDVRDPSEVLGEISSYIAGNRVYVIGAGPSALSRGLEDYRHSIAICADGACILAREHGLPAISVTDLDGGIEPAEIVYKHGGYIVLQFHGDNYRYLASLADVLKRWRDRLVIGVQIAPPCSHVTEIPGFTDGDRAYLLALSMGASEIITIGMDLDSEFTTNLSKSKYPRITFAPINKIRKLRWAKRIIEDLYQMYL